MVHTGDASLSFSGFLQASNYRCIGYWAIWRQILQREFARLFLCLRYVTLEPGKINVELFTRFEARELRWSLLYWRILRL